MVHKKRVVFVWMVLLTTVLQLGSGWHTSKAVAADDSAQREWILNAIVYPVRDQLNPAGPVEIEWKNANVFSDQVIRYDVFVNGRKLGEVPQSASPTLCYRYYTTKIAEYTVRIEAVGPDVSTQADFLITKKGIGYFNDLSRMHDMNLGWYYNWGTAPSNTAPVRELDYVPMIWGANTDWLHTAAAADYHTVLGFNEPDFAEQSNISVPRAIELWPAFEEYRNTGGRIGSPAVAWDYGWLDQFMAGIDNQADFIAVHSYPGWTDAQGFIRLIQDLHDKYNKPIWVTEFAVASWPSQQSNHQSWGYTEQMVYDYMQTVLTFLNNAEYVERYAWFSFGQPDGNPYGEDAGSYSALVVRHTGELTELGRLYRDMGNPEKSEPGDNPEDVNLALGRDVYVSSEEHYGTLAANAVDGNQNTRWSSASTDDEWIYVDLGEIRTVSRVILHWETACADTYKLQVSNDAGVWRDVKTVDCMGGTETVTFEPEQARYVKMQGLSRATQYGYSIWEMGIYQTH